MRTLLLMCGLSLVTWAQDARSIIARSVEVTNLDPSLRQAYTYRERTEQRQIDGAGQLQTKETAVREVLYLGGKRVSHLVERNGKPLPEKEEREQQAKLDKAVAEANKLTEADRAKRATAEEKNQQEDREMLRRIPDAFDLKLLGESTVNGRRVWQIACTPRADYRGKNADLFKKLKGTIAVDQQDYHWVRVEAESLDTFSFGLFLARIAPGTKFLVELARINDEIWMPSRFEFSGTARLALLKKLTVNQLTTFSDFKRYRTESKLTTIEEGR